MGVTTRVVAATVFVGAAALGGQPGSAAEDDVPKREPSLVWEVPVECDSDAELATSTGSSRHCVLAFGGDGVYVHEHSGDVGSGGPFRLSAFDTASGALRWTRDVGEAFELRLTDEAIVLSDKAHIEVFDPETGALRFTRDGGLVHQNSYGVLIMGGADTITAVDAANGAELWSSPGQVGAMCRDFVAIVPAASRPAGPFTLVEHRTGAERWTSDVDFDPSTDHMACSGAPWIYVSDGERIFELDSFDGWTTWETAVSEAGVIDLYREVALVRSGPRSETVVAVRREDGTVMWEAPAASVGSSLSWVGRLREDAAGLFTMIPLTGDTVQRVDFNGTIDAPFDVVGLSDTRVVVAVGSVVTTYGMNDLGMAWQLDVGGTPDDFGVSGGYLVVRSGAILRGYGVAPQTLD